MIDGRRSRSQASIAKARATIAAKEPWAPINPWAPKKYGTRKTPARRVPLPAEVMQLLRAADGPMTTTAVADALEDVSVATVRAVLNELVEQGRVRVMRRGNGQVWSAV